MVKRGMMIGKSHTATVMTDANIDYVGIITLDPDLIESSGMLPFEQVQAVNVNNGSRFETTSSRESVVSARWF